jgi:hypothetical protein
MWWSPTASFFSEEIHFSCLLSFNIFILQWPSFSELVSSVAFCLVHTFLLLVSKSYSFLLVLLSFFHSFIYFAFSVPSVSFCCRLPPLIMYSATFFFFPVHAAVFPVLLVQPSLKSQVRSSQWCPPLSRNSSISCNPLYIDVSSNNFYYVITACFPVECDIWPTAVFPLREVGATCRVLRPLPPAWRAWNLMAWFFLPSSKMWGGALQRAPSPSPGAEWMKWLDIKLNPLWPLAGKKYCFQA